LKSSNVLTVSRDGPKLACGWAASTAAIMRTAAPQASALPVRVVNFTKISLIASFRDEQGYGNALTRGRQMYLHCRTVAIEILALHYSNFESTRKGEEPVPL
jgi:hypothetical protein